MASPALSVFEGVSPVAAEVRQLTLRAVLFGMFIGGALSLCNIYSGLKIGFTTNMSIAAALLAYGFYRLAASVTSSSPLSLHENVVNQTTASAAASIAGAGLVAPIPALTMLTGYEFRLPLLCAWALSVSLIGVFVGVGLRRQMIELESLPFPYGVATATLLREMYSKGREALLRVNALLAAAALGALLKAVVALQGIGVAWLRGTIATKAQSSFASLKNLGFGFDPSVLMVGVGGLIGVRCAASMFVGAVFAWLGLAPWIVERGWVDASNLPTDSMWFAPLANWLLWPGTALMVGSALTSFGWGLPRLLRALMSAQRSESGDADQSNAGQTDPRSTELPWKWFAMGLVGAGLFSVAMQFYAFEVGIVEAALAVVLSFGLAIVAGRVSGETGIAPIGAMGKITQLTFAIISPGNPTANLMSANVTGGAASQCSDMLHDLKTGHLLGAWPRHQALAQLLGVLAGSVAGSAGYLVLIPDPANQLITEQWPAPAVAQWKAVAELFTQGLGHLPPGAAVAAIVALVASFALATLERFSSQKWRPYVPSAASIGLAFVIPAYYSVSVLLGALLASALARFALPFAQRFTLVIACGLIAGESLAGVALALQQMLGFG